MRVRKTHGSSPTFVAVLVLPAIAGCTIEFLRPDDSTHNVPATTITVRLVNQTGKPLDPQLYIGPSAGGVDGLFVPANKRTDFGFGKLGLLEADASAELAIDCDQQVLIGTQGGIFGDDLTVPLGHGQPFVLQMGVNLPCGYVLAFTFTATGNDLKTSYSVAPR